MSNHLYLPENERDRLQALINFNLLLNMPERELDVIVQLAASICHVPVAVISIFESNVQHIKSSFGLNIYEVRSDFDFGFHVYKNNKFTEIPDALLDPEMIKNRLVIGHPNFRFFAGIPIQSSEGSLVGTLCVIDTQQRQLNKDQIDGLNNLSRQITNLLDLRKQNKNLQTELNQLLHERINQTEIDLAAYKFALDQSSGVAIADQNGFIKFANDKFCKSAGYIKEELLGQAYSIFNSGHHHPDFFVAMWDRISQGELWHGEIRNKDKNGNYFWVDCSIIPFRDKKGRTYQYMAIQQDITEKKSAQDRMTLEARLISILSENHNIKQSIQHICEQICYRLEWEIGVYWQADNQAKKLSPFSYYQFTYPHNDAFKNEMLKQALQIGEGIAGRTLLKKQAAWIYDLKNEIYPFDQQTAEHFGFHSTLAFPVLFNNEVFGILQFYSSKTKKADQNIVQMLESTSLQIGAFIERKKAEEELLKAKQQAEESVISKDQFLANMSHEIRTPMNAIIGFTELLTETGLNHKQFEYAQSVKIAGENLLSIINDILDFSKIESGVVNIEQAPTDIEEVLKNIYDLLKISAIDKNLNFAYNFDSNIPEYVMCDGLRLNQILINLVGNAIKFTENGSVLFSAELLSSNGLFNDIKFTVKDTGIGIQHEKKDKIFERFTQVNNEINRKYEGTGLGLSISKSLIELMHSSLELNSQEGLGSEFHFTLRLQTGFKNEIRQNNFNQLKNNSVYRPHILVIEDNYLNQKLAKNVLQKFDFDVDLANNGQVGITMLKNKSYDAVLMDIQMPELDGYQTTLKIRHELQLNTPIIAMTAHSIVGEKDKCIAVGMNDFISKPFDPEQLYQKIVQQLSNTPYSVIHSSSDSNSNKNPQNYIQELANGNKAFEEEMTRLFLEQVPKDILELDRYLQEKDLSKTKAQIHKLKSSLEIFGLQSIAAEMALIPGYMLEENGDFKIQTTVNHINQALSEFYKQLKPNHQLTETY